LVEGFVNSLRGPFIVVIFPVFPYLSHLVVYLKACFAVISVNWGLIVSLFRYMYPTTKYVDDDCEFI